MRHGYPTTMGHGAPVTVLKRGLNGSTQIDTRVKYLNTFLKVLCILYFSVKYYILIKRKYIRP